MACVSSFTLLFIEPAWGWLHGQTAGLREKWRFWWLVSPVTSLDFFEKLFLGRARGKCVSSDFTGCSPALTNSPHSIIIPGRGQRIFSFTSQWCAGPCGNPCSAICLLDFERMQFKKYRGPPWQCSGSGLLTSTSGHTGSIPGQGTRPHIPRGVAKTKQIPTTV